MHSIHVVLAAANPRGTTALQLDEEVRRIEEQIAQSAYTEGLAGQSGKSAKILLRAVWAAHLIDLVRNVAAFEPSIVHFSGHGEGQNGLLMVGQDARPAPVEAQILRDILEEFRSSTRLVFLNACYSAVQAEQIRQGIDCVIGMRHGISDAGASLFAAALYGQLALGSSIGRAFRLARAVMSAQSAADAEVPCLLCRDGINADQVFLTATAASPAKAEEWQTMLQASNPPRSVLRRAINLALPKDADLEAFVADRRSDPRYARVHREWGSDMQRQRKLNLLFDYGPSTDELKADLLEFAG